MNLIDKLVRRAVRNPNTGRITTWMTEKEYNNVNNFEALKEILIKHNIKAVEIRSREVETVVYNCEKKIS